MRQWPTASGRAGQRRKRRKNLERDCQADGRHLTAFFAALEQKLASSSALT